MGETGLLAAYLATDYVVFDFDAEVVIRIGEVPASLDTLLDRLGEKCWAFVTAWNPGSHVLPPTINEARQRQLVESIVQHGFAWRPGEGRGADGRWREASVLVLGIHETGAVELGRRFGQNAVVVGEAGGPARLVWCGASA